MTARTRTAASLGDKASSDALPAEQSDGREAGLPRSATLSSPTDQLNRAIVRLLQDDGRLPFKTIADRSSTSPKAPCATGSAG